MHTIVRNHKINVMNYTIIGICSTEKSAFTISKKLIKAGFIKEFPGFFRNTLFQPESLVEDHYLEGNEIYIYTPNLNRAYKAQNILVQMDAQLKKWIGQKTEKNTGRSKNSNKSRHQLNMPNIVTKSGRLFKTKTCNK